jgi:tripartite-type tricarboxylate transporter receptor subunit TctC
VIIENKPGAGTTIGLEMAAETAPDGYTLPMATFAHVVNPSLVAKLQLIHAPYRGAKLVITRLNA